MADQSLYQKEGYLQNDDGKMVITKLNEQLGQERLPPQVVSMSEPVIFLSLSGY